MIHNALGSKWVRCVWKQLIQSDTRARVTITVSHIRLLSFLQVAGCPGHTPGEGGGEEESVCCRRAEISRGNVASSAVVKGTSRCIARVYSFPLTRRVATLTSPAGPGCVFTTVVSGHLPFARVSSLRRTTFPGRTFSCGLVHLDLLCRLCR